MIGHGGGWRAGGYGRTLVTATAVGVALALAVGAATATAASWHWAKGYVPTGRPGSFSSISCPSTKLCVAAGTAGRPGSGGTNDIFWTTNPTGGKASWHHVALEADVQPQLGGGQEEVITAVSCTAQGHGHYYCAATDGFANLWQTGDPASGKWSSAVLDQDGLVDLSCWSVYCGILDLDSNALVTAGAQTLNSTSNVFSLPEGTSELSISCNSDRFCAAADVSHKVAWTTNETDPNATWHHSSVRGADLDTIACPSAKLCVATEGEDDETAEIGVSRNPGGGGGTWKAVRIAAAKGGVYTASCESTSFCTVAGSTDGAGGPTGSGLVLTSTNPAAKASAWHAASVSFPDISSVSCPTKSECLAVESNAGHVALGRLR
jgi:hypothetical protein